MVIGAAVIAVPLALVVRRPTRPEDVDALRPIERPEGRIRVEVLNAGGVSGLARDATDFLRDHGFDVVYFGNAGSFDADSTLVFDRVGRPEAARAVAEALGIDNVVDQPDPNRFADVSVWLGSGWSSATSVGGRGAEGTGRWWDPRAWWSR